MRRSRLYLTGLAWLLWLPLEATAQNDTGTLEVLVEDPSGRRSPDGTPSLTFETRKVSNLERVDIGPGRSITDSGQRIGTGSGTVITPTVTESDLVTEASGYPQNFRHVTKDSLGRIWATAKEPRGGLYVFSDSTWRRVSFSGPQGVSDLGRDAQGRIWVAGNFGNAYRISGNTLTKYSGFEDLGVGTLSTLAAGSGDTVWMGGYSVVGREPNPALFLRFDGREWRRFSGADGLPDYATIDEMAVDSTGTVWGKPFYDVPDYLAGRGGIYPSLVSYDGREWRGYEFSLGPHVEDSDYVGMIVDPGGTLWVSSSSLAYKTASGWMSYEYVLTGGRRMRRSMAAERAGRIWIQGDGGWIGVFESGQFYRTPTGSNPDVFGSPFHRPPQKLYYDGEVLWTAGSRLGRWRLPGQGTSVEDEPGPGSSGQSRLLDSYPNPFNARTTIGFELDRRQPVSLRVHNLTGQRVTTLAEGVYPEGAFAVSWDGRDDRGREVASGVYLARLRLAERAFSHPLTLVR